MQIDKIEVENFRGFSKREFLLNPSFTVAIGDNGTGKSTLLHAMQIATGAFFLGLTPVNRRHIEDDEIRVSFNPTSKQWIHHTPTRVKATGFINGSGEFTWQREIPEYGKSTSSKKADVGKIRSIAEEYAASIDSPQRPLLPLIAFFGVRQLGGKPKRQKRTKFKRVIIRDGYYNALGPKSDESSFTEWFYYYEDNFKNGMEFEGTYQAVINAIEKAIPFLKNVSFDRIQLELEADCEIPGQPKRKLLQNLMSDGLKRMLGIVVDIAYRCVILNGHKGINAVEETKGIVMIDELDMHLHPNWQRHVVSDLKKGFPNIQFVVTTHSPFIVQSLRADELIIIDDNIRKDGDPLKKSIEGVSANEMGVEDIPRSIEFLEMQGVAEEYYSLIEKGNTSESDGKTAQLRNQLNKLEEKFGEDPAFVAALKIERKSKGL